MDNRLTFICIEQFIAIRFPDQEPEILSVRAFRAVTSLLVAAAVLKTAEPCQLQDFTGYHPAFIASVSWNMRNNGLWTAAGYDTSDWLSSSGDMDDRMFLEHFDIAAGTTWCPDAEFLHDAIDVNIVYRDLNASLFGLRRQSCGG
jgi:hypothetical protein